MHSDVLRLALMHLHAATTLVSTSVIASAISAVVAVVVTRAPRGM